MKQKLKLPPKNEDEFFTRLAELLDDPPYQQLFDLIHVVIEKTYPRAEGDKSARNLQATGEIVLFIDAWATHILKSHKEARRGT